MKIVKQGFELMEPIDRSKILNTIERAARTCYKSEGDIKRGSASKLVSKLIQKGHTAMLEHASISVRFITDRGVTHEIVRHRIASYAQESTRYCNYFSEKFGKEIQFISPVFWKRDSKLYKLWEDAMMVSEIAYMRMIEMGASPQQARTVLPNSLKTEIVVTMNLRSWMNFFRLRCAPDAHPQMVEITRRLRKEFAKKLPEIFGFYPINITPNFREAEAILRKSLCKLNMGRSSDEIKKILNELGFKENK